jgi:hypothetical protein
MGPSSWPLAACIAAQVVPEHQQSAVYWYQEDFEQHCLFLLWLQDCATILDMDLSLMSLKRSCCQSCIQVSLRLSRSGELVEDKLSSCACRL